MEKIKQMLYIVIGSFITAIAINIFFVPHNISSGGASGVGIMLNFLFSLPVGTTVIMLNLPLFIVAVYKLGFKFVSKAILGTTLLSVFIDITSALSTKTVFNIGNDLILSSIFGGAVMGLGLSLVFKGKASTGGTELLAQIVYKYRPVISISQLMLSLDALIIICSAIVFKSLSSAMYSLIAIFVSKKIIDTVFEGVNYTKILNVITKNKENISKRIIEEVERGATTIRCVGEYTKGEYTKIECVATIPQIYKIKEIVRQEDSKAFMYIAPASEVLGYGFKE